MSYVSIHKAALLTDTAEVTVRALIKRGKVPACRLPGKRCMRIRESDLHLIHEHKRPPISRIAGSDFGDGLLTVAEAAKEADVFPATIFQLIREGTIRRAEVPEASTTCIHRDDLPKVIATKAVPMPGDPTPEEIKQRAAEVRRMQQAVLAPDVLQRRQILRLLARQGGLTADLAAIDLKCCTGIAGKRLNELESAGLVESVGHSPRRYFLAGELGEFAGMDSADVILARFRKSAIRATKNRNRPAVAA